MKVKDIVKALKKCNQESKLVFYHLNSKYFPTPSKSNRKAKQTVNCKAAKQKEWPISN